MGEVVGRYLESCNMLPLLENHHPMARVLLFGYRDGDVVWLQANYTQYPWHSMLYFDKLDFHREIRTTTKELTQDKSFQKKFSLSKRPLLAIMLGAKTFSALIYTHAEDAASDEIYTDSHSSGIHPEITEAIGSNFFFSSV